MSTVGSTGKALQHSNTTAKKSEVQPSEHSGDFNPDTASSRPQASVQSISGGSPAATLSLPAVFLSPIRPDVVHFVHTSMAKNSRQAYAVSPGAGHQHSAESWGTGRAVARIPRVSGGGTGRAGQGAFGNQCRKGRMFAPTKTWRRWHRKLNVNQKRYAVASALAASALPALVMARGHRIDETPEIPLVVDDSVQSLKKTKEAVAALKALGAYVDVQKAIDSKNIRAGKGKMRNRRYTMARGPLVVYNENSGLTRAFRNIPGVDTAHVDKISLLQLAPGGHLGRFIIWSQSAFQRLVENWGSQKQVSHTKHNYHLPRPLMTNSDVTRIIDSQEISSKVRAPIKQVRLPKLHGNPLKNQALKDKLNPYAAELRKSEITAHKRRTEARAASIEQARQGKFVPSEQRKARTARAKAHGEGKKQQVYARFTDDSQYEGFEPTKNVIEAQAEAEKTADV